MVAKGTWLPPRAPESCPRGSGAPGNGSIRMTIVTDPLG